MIGARSVVLGLIVAVALAALVGPGGQGPADRLAAERLVADRARGADAALADLSAALMPALDAARRGSGRLVTGDASPGDALRDAAEHVAAAEGAATAARRAVDALRGALQAVGPAPALDAPAPPGELASIAAQLEGTAAAADAFAVQRDRAVRLVATLGDALAALEDRDTARAERLVAEARSDHAALEAWEVGVVTLPVWLATTGSLVDALGRLLRALAAGDDAGADAAAREVAALADEAVSADRALRIAIAEGAEAVARAPLARLADVMRGIDETRLTVASILQTVGR